MVGMSGRERCRLGEGALESGGEWCGEGRFRLGEGVFLIWSNVGERDVDWERAHLRVEGNVVEEGDTDWERAHLIGWKWCAGERCRLIESALESGRIWC